MSLYKTKQLSNLQVARGINARVVPGETMTVLHVTIDEGAILPEHSHHHEQILNMIEGSLKLMVDGQEFQLTAGDVMVLEPNVVHSGRAMSECKVVDVFHPVRQEFVGGAFAGYPTESTE